MPYPYIPDGPKTASSRAVPGTNVRKMIPRPLADRAPVGRDTLLSQILQVPELQRLDYSAAGERPEFDAKRSKQLKYANAAALLMAGLAGVADAPIGAHIMSGAAQGYSAAGMRQQDLYDARLKAYYDRALEVGQYNADVANEEAKMGYQATRDAAREQGEYLRQDADLKQKRAELEQEAALEREKLQADRAKAEESSRHNREMEKAAQVRAQAARDRARTTENIEGVTGKIAAVRGIEFDMQQLADEIRQLQQSEDAILYRDLIESRMTDLERLRRQRYEILSDMKRTDVEALETREDTKPNSPSLFDWSGF